MCYEIEKFSVELIPRIVQEAPGALLQRSHLAATNFRPSLTRRPANDCQEVARAIADESREILRSESRQISIERETSRGAEVELVRARRDRIMIDGHDRCEVGTMPSPRETARTTEKLDDAASVRRPRPRRSIPTRPSSRGILPLSARCSHMRNLSGNPAASRSNSAPIWRSADNRAGRSETVNAGGCGDHPQFPCRHRISTLRGP
jgi:hypothetical protein